MHKSQKANQLFANEVSRLSIESGVDINIARNVLRWRKSNVKPPRPKDYKYGLPLDSVMSPSQHVNQFGTKGGAKSKYPERAFSDANDHDSNATWLDAIENGMVNHNGILYTSQEWKEMNR